MTANAKISAADRAFAALRDAIMSGELAPGSMISEAAYAESLSLSRTPVRSALTRLQDEGWVTIYPRRGALVREITAEEVRESAEVRRALESAGVAQGDAAARARLADALEANLQAQERALAEENYPRFEELTRQFHRSFVELAENSMMLSIYDRLQDYLRLSVARCAPRVTDDPALTIDEHRSLMADAVAGDAVSFGKRLREHQARLHRLY